MSVQITVADVRAPAPGKKQASIIDATGKRWGIPASEQGNYHQFGIYEVTRFKESLYQGKMYYTIETAVPVMGGNGGTAQSSVRAAPEFSTRPAQPYSEDQRRMDIFVSVMLNNSHIDPATSDELQLVDTVLKFKRVWKRAFGPQPDPISSGNGELDDKIPF